MRLIDADELIRVIRDDTPLGLWKNSSLDKALKAMGKTIEIVEAMPSAPRWTPVSERPPEAFEKVIVFWSDGCVTDGERTEDDDLRGWRFLDGSGFHPDGGSGNTIVAWMPQPEPYREEAKHEDH